jgi:hypothetical protein
MRTVTYVLDTYLYDELTSFATRLYMASMLEYVACCQFWGVSAKIGDPTQTKQHVSNMLVTYHAKAHVLLALTL